MASYSIVDIGPDYIEIAIRNAVIGNKYAVYIHKEGESAPDPWDYPYTARVSSFNIYISGLEPDTYYIMNIDGNYQGGGSIWLGGQTFTTESLAPSNPPEYSIGNITATSVNVVIEHLEPYSSAYIYCHPDGEQSLKPIGAGANSLGVALVTIGGLSPNTLYIINVDTNPGGSANWLGAQSFTTLRGRPTDWWWRSDVESEAEINISASEWNDFCKRINEFREYVNVGTYDLEIVSSGDYITASIVNKARSAIDGATGHGTLPSRAYAESYIYASFFNQLKDALNAIP